MNFGIFVVTGFTGDILWGKVRSKVCGSKLEMRKSSLGEKEMQGEADLLYPEFTSLT